MKLSHLPLCLTLLLPLSAAALAQEQIIPLIDPSNELPEVLNAPQISELVAAVDRGLASLSKLQKEDGSFPTISYGQPAITALAAMAYLSRGHLPGKGPYGETIEKAINYVLSQQKESGMFSHQEIEYDKINVVIPSGPEAKNITSKSYNHAICMLMLGEAYGMTNENESFRIRNAIEKGLKFTIQLWNIRPHRHEDEGGFRYTRPWNDNFEADVSVTGWHAASLRSIRNAGFDIPQEVMERIAAYVIRNQRKDGGFAYSRYRSSSYMMTAAGTLCLSLAGKQGSPEARRAAAFLSHFRCDDPKAFIADHHRFPYYGCYYITQASIQLGGQLWITCMGECSRYLLKKQSADGLWPPSERTANCGPSYSTSMAIIALTPVLQILPIYQR